MIALVEPVIANRPLTQTVNYGSPVTFSCAVTGNPKPDITWLYRDVLISTSDRYSVNDGTLTVLASSLADIGSYTCRASNIVSNGTQLVHLSVNASAHLTVVGTPIC